LLEWAEENDIIQRHVHALMKDFSRSVEKKTRDRRRVRNDKFPASHIGEFYDLPTIGWHE
jgi:hypothetical protein